MAYQIITDGSWDMGSDIASKLDVKVIPFYISWEEGIYKKEVEDVSVREIYEYMTNHPESMLHTSLPAVTDISSVFEEYAKQELDIVYFSVSSKFSGAYNAAMIARDMILETYPNIRIAVIDSKQATLEQGLIVQEAALARNREMDFDTLVSECDRIIETSRIFFSVSNLDYLIKGGRVGKLAGISANVLNLNPMIYLSEGELQTAGVVRGRKKARQKAASMLIEYVAALGKCPEDFTFIIGYGYDIEEGEILRELFFEKMHDRWPDYNTDIVRAQIGATIGVHTGPTPIGYGIVEKIKDLNAED